MPGRRRGSESGSVIQARTASAPTRADFPVVDPGPTRGPGYNRSSNPKPGANMSDTVPQKTVQPAPKIEDRDFTELLKSLVGKTVTMVNPESFEPAPVGHQLRAGFYRAKITGMGRDYLIVATEMSKKGGETEPVRQYIPLKRIQRVSLMKSERLIHL